MISSRASPKKHEAAWALIRFLTDPTRQKMQARDARLLPILVDLYDDPLLTRDVPVMALGKQVFEANLRSRPKTPFYGELSSHIARVFNQTLKGELTGRAAVEILDREFRAIAIRN